MITAILVYAQPVEIYGGGGKIGHDDRHVLGACDHRIGAVKTALMGWARVCMHVAQ